MSLSTFPFPLYHPQTITEIFFLICYLCTSGVTKQQTNLGWHLPKRKLQIGLLRHMERSGILILNWFPCNNQPGQLCAFSHKTLAFPSSSGTKQEIYTCQLKFGDHGLIFLSENLLRLWKLYHIKMTRHLREAHSFALNQEPSTAMIYITCSLPASVSLTCDREKYSIILVDQGR